MALYNTDIEAVSTYHIADKQLYQPAVSNAFTFIVNPNLSKLLYAGIDRSTVDEADAGDDNYLNNVDDTIRLSVVSGKIPHFTLEPIEIRRGNSKLTYAGLPSFDNEELTLHDFVGARTKDALMAWQAKAYDVVKDIVRPAQDYKYDCQLVEYTPDMSQIIRSWDLKGCWISSISEDPFNVEERNKRTITATIQYDRAIPTHNVLSYPYATATE